MYSTCNGEELGLRMSCMPCTVTDCFRVRHLLYFLDFFDSFDTVGKSCVSRITFFTHDIVDTGSKSKSKIVVQINVHTYIVDSTYM